EALRYACCIDRSGEYICAVLAAWDGGIYCFRRPPTMTNTPERLAHRQLVVRPEWLALRQEEIIEPALPIVDAHHHFWNRDGIPYLLPELLADTNSGHNIVATVFMECKAMYRKHAPPAMQPIGEVEFVNGIAAMSASGEFGPTRVAAGIVGYADLGLGAA